MSLVNLKEGLEDGTRPRVLPLELQSLLAQWMVFCAGRQMPDRRDLPLRALDRWLDQIAVINLMRYGGLRRYAFAFCGQALVGRLGCDAMGMELRDLERPIWTGLLKTFETTTMAPTVSCYRAPQSAGAIRAYCDLVLPLSDGADRASQLLFGSYTLSDP
jgi:hypothetical protein